MQHSVPALSYWVVRRTKNFSERKPNNSGFAISNPGWPLLIQAATKTLLEGGPRTFAKGLLVQAPVDVRLDYFLMSKFSLARRAAVERKTKETKIRVAVNLDGAGVYKINTGIGFLDHMMEQLSRHSLMDLEIEASGDLHIDFHHTTEDVAICIGEAVSKALGERAGICRYGSAVIPMDETLTEVAIDLSNRPYLIWKVVLSKPKLGEMDTELFKEWFQAFSQAAGVTLHVSNRYGENNHHIVESCFKGLARSLRQAVDIDPRKADAVPSTKGILGGSL